MRLNGNLEQYKLAAEQGDAEAAYELGNVYYYGVKADRNELEEWLSSDEVREFERQHRTTPQRERDLLFSAVLMTQNWQSLKVLPMIKDTAAAKNAAGILKSAWSITKTSEAISTLAYLSTADGHTTDLDEQYQEIQAGGRPTVEFNTAKKLLIGLGYTEAELMTIPTLAAWDYGRCGFIARFARYLDFIDDDTAWRYISQCAENAAQAYDSWHQYLAAYVLGRSLWGSDCLDIEYVLDFLLHNQNSPFKYGIEIKPGYKDNFAFRYPISIEPDYGEAAKWYIMAAERGHIAAQSALGSCYDAGHGVLEDETEALKWYKKAAEKGNAEAQYNLATCYYLGRCGIAKDRKMAQQLYSEAATQGHENAQGMLSQMKGVRTGKIAALVILGIAILIGIAILGGIYK